MKRIIIISFLIVMAIGAATPSMALWGKNFRLAGAFDDDMLLGGQAGKLTTQSYDIKPNLGKLYPNGVGARFELAYMYDENWEILLGSGFSIYKGGSTSLTAGNGDSFRLELSDFNIIPLYVGGRFVFSEDPKQGFAPYARGDVGVIFNQPVNGRVTFRSTDPARQSAVFVTKWWRSSAVMMWDIGGGVQYGFEKFNVFGEVLYTSYGKLDSAASSPISSISVSGAGTQWAPIVFRLGASYFF